MSLKTLALPPVNNYESDIIELFIFFPIYFDFFLIYFKSDYWFSSMEIIYFNSLSFEDYVKG